MGVTMQEQMELTARAARYLSGAGQDGVGGAVRFSGVPSGTLNFLPLGLFIISSRFTSTAGGVHDAVTVVVPAVIVVLVVVVIVL